MDAKITALDENTTPASTDLTVIVDDPGSTPATQKMTLDTLDDYLSATTKTLTNKIIGGSQLVDSSVTTAKITNPYMFSAYPSAGTSLVNATTTKITFGTEDYDYNNNFASSTYTAPVDGVYQFNATFNLGIVVSGVVAFCAIYVNDALVKRGAKVPITSGCGATISTDILLAANDTVDVYGYQSSAGDEGTVVNADRTYFNGHLVAQV